MKCMSFKFVIGATTRGGGRGGGELMRNKLTSFRFTTLTENRPASYKCNTHTDDVTHAHTERTSDDSRYTNGALAKKGKETKKK